MLDDPRDLERMRDGIRRVLDLGESDAIRAIAAGPLTATVEPPTRTASDDEIDAWALRTADDAAHVCATARMGAAADTKAVVDPRCRVHGLERLRVVDASIFPGVPRANTHLAVLAVAERAALLLRSSSEVGS